MAWESGIAVIYQASDTERFDGGSRVALDDDFGLSMTFGIRLERLELGLGLDWQRIGYDAVLRSAQLSNVSVDVAGDLEIFTPRLYANYDLIRGSLSPYINGGIGWSFIDTNIPNERVQVGCWWDPWWGYVCTPYQTTKTIDDFAYQLGVGVRWDFVPGYTLRAGYERHWIDYDKASSTFDLDQWKLGVSLRF